jgi:hypothetical protein
VIDRSAKARGDDELRIKTRLIATTSIQLFGKRNLALVADVVSVGIGVEIPPKSVENWTADVPNKKPC